MLLLLFCIDPWARHHRKEGNNFTKKRPPLAPLYTVSLIDAHIGITTFKTKSNPFNIKTYLRVTRWHLSKFFVSRKYSLLST